MVEEPSDADLHAALEELRPTQLNLLTFHGARDHETLMTMFYLFSMQLISDGTQASGTKEELLALMGHTRVRGQACSKPESPCTRLVDPP